MTVVDETYEVEKLPEPTDKMGVLRFLEKIGRVCYKSEDKITDLSCIKFLQGIRNRGHWAVLEHYIFVFAVPGYVIQRIYDPAINSCNNDLEYADKLKYINISIYDQFGDGSSYIGLISASATSLNYIWNTKTVKILPSNPFRVICEYMNDLYPQIMKVPDDYHDNNSDLPGYDCVKSSKFTPRLLTRAEIEALPIEQRLIHDSMSVRFRVPIAITHEIVRHRPASYAQESTRYCNYGKKGFTVIKPKYIDIHSNTFNKWLDQMLSDEKVYNALLEDGVSTQIAANVLPKSTKSEIEMTARLGEWKHFFDMRADTHAHPQMREVAVPLLADCIAKDPEIYGEYGNRLEENREYLIQTERA